MVQLDESAAVSDDTHEVLSTPVIKPPASLVAGVAQSVRAKATPLLVVGIMLAVMLVCVVAGAQDSAQVSAGASTGDVGGMAGLALNSAPWLTLMALGLRELSNGLKDWARDRGVNIEAERARADKEEEARKVAETRAITAEATLRANGWTQDMQGNWSK